ncbi:MAG: lipopolysaccharide core biosynthesis protein [Verrucomicrobiales bacterium]|nr:lipopolysaccharide core biosynthesis protein [Verrucomicrobiales bacterium]
MPPTPPPASSGDSTFLSRALELNPVRRSLLAVRRGALGDFILTLPALEELRESRPGVEIQLLTLPAYGALATHFGFADGWRSLESAPAALFQDGAEVAPEWRKWLAGFQEIVSWLPDRDGAFRRQLAANGAPTAAFRQAPWLATPPDSGEEPEPAARQFGKTVAPACRNHALLPFEKAAGLHTLPPAPVHPVHPSRTIALHSGSGSPRKNWPFPRWVEVMTSLQQAHPGLRWLLITGEAEEASLPAMCAALNAAGLPWESVHGLDLISLAGHLHQCAALLGHDSGISHLAAACGVPCFLLFGPTDPAVWAPAADWVQVLRAPGGDLSGISVPDAAAWLHGKLPYSQ